MKQSSDGPHSPGDGVPDAPEPWASAQAGAITPVSSDAAPPFRSVGFTTSSTGYAIARRFRELLAPVGLEPREFALLRAVGNDEGQSQQAVGDRLGIPPSRMVAFVDGLEQRGLLERRSNPADRRTRALYLTSAGRESLASAFALAVGYERDLCADLSEAEREQLLDLLGRIGQRLGLRPGMHSGHGHSALGDE